MAPPTPCSSPGGEQHGSAAGCRGQSTGGDEDDDAHQQQPAPTEQVAHAPDRDQQGREHERVDRVDPLGLGDAEREVLDQHRQDHVHDGGVHDDDRHRERDDHHREPALGVRALSPCAILGVAHGCPSIRCSGPVACFLTPGVCILRPSRALAKLGRVARGGASATCRRFPRRPWPSTAGASARRFWQPPPICSCRAASRLSPPRPSAPRRDWPAPASTSTSIPPPGSWRRSSRTRFRARTPSSPSPSTASPSPLEVMDAYVRETLRQAAEGAHRPAAALSAAQLPERVPGAAGRTAPRADRAVHGGAAAARRARSHDHRPPARRGARVCHGGHRVRFRLWMPSPAPPSP